MQETKLGQNKTYLESREGKVDLWGRRHRPPSGVQFGPPAEVPCQGGCRSGSVRARRELCGSGCLGESGFVGTEKQLILT